MKSSNFNRSSIIKVRESGPAVDFHLRRQGLEDLVRLAVGDRASSSLVNSLFDMFERPNDVVAGLDAARDPLGPKISLFGPIEQRFVFVGADRGGGYGISFGPYGAERLSPAVAQRIGPTKALTPRVFQFEHEGGIFRYLEEPRIYLAALYHPEIFPLPRLSLAISDLVRAARQADVASVYASDMQLGMTVADLAADIVARRPHILGISATFGQHDVLDELIAAVVEAGWPENCQLVFGGSLCALNRDVLLERFPEAVVAMGPGERTIGDIISMHRGELRLEQVGGIAFKAPSGSIRETATVSPRDSDEILPELDLLDETFQRRGVAQLESSRGCSYACSFCPRKHKGIWAGDDPKALSAVIPDIRRILGNHLSVTPKVFLVDEEFFGYRANDESENRVLGVADILNSHGLRFETSSRADQVYRRNKDPEWHRSRIATWRGLIDKGLDRCLFGIESGVDSILLRFNKKTTAEQNGTAIRILSLAGVPPRYTYITFDPLMSRDELIESYKFQARTDLLLPAAPKLTDEAIFRIAVSDELSRDRAEGKPFYKSISYMLVSMECLKGAPYTECVRAQGLLGAFNPNMGRYEASYRDPDIGLFSDCSQRWIDRNFSIDYLLKSIEKYTDGTVRRTVHAMREVVKDFAFELLGKMIELWDPDASGLPRRREDRSALCARSSAFTGAALEEKKRILLALMDEHFEEMRTAMRSCFADASVELPDFERARIEAELERWSSQKTWRQINELPEAGSAKTVSPDSG